MRQQIMLLILGVPIALLIFVVLQREIFFKIRKPRVAIIGGGIGGASASHFLTELFNGRVTIDLYEAKTIGGRLSTIKINGDEVEAGGMLMHPINILMQRFVKLLDLDKISFSDRKFGVWNGDSIMSLDRSFITVHTLFQTYGSGPYNLQRHVNYMIQDFLKIHALQNAGQSFTNVTTLLSTMNKNFPKQLQISIRNYLLNMGFTEKIIKELVQAATVANYGQEVDIHSFVGLLSVTAFSNSMWSAKSGNKMIPQLLINRNKKVSVVQNRVTKIRNLKNISESSQYEVTHINKDSTAPITSNYDIVIIAAPLTIDQEFPIEFVGFPDKLVFPGNYQTTYATFVKADLNLEYFGLQQTLDGILSCNPNKTTISLIFKANPVDGSIKENSRLWKIFSREHMDRSFIDNMFSNVTEIKEIGWNAYPRYSTNIKSDNFKLHDALYYVNAIEWAASMMEMSAIAGRNVAILAHNNFLKKSYDFVSNNTAKDSTENIRIPAEL